MRDDHLLQDLEPLPYAQDTLFALKDHAITTYSQLFALLRDETANPEARKQGCYALARPRLNRRYLPPSYRSLPSDTLDHRRAVPPLLIALKSSDRDIGRAAAYALGMLRSRRAIIPLMKLLRDKSQPPLVRHDTVDALANFRDEAIIALFWQIIDDPDENVLVRGRAIEMIYEQPDPVQKYIELLSDPISDIRFWAAYRLSFSSPSQALSKLDDIVAFDHTLPTYWGWQVDREAILPLETIYFRKILGIPDEDEDSYPWYGMGPIYLLSPAPEYDTFTHDYRRWSKDWVYENIKPLPPITLNIEPTTFANQLQTNWPQIRLNIRQPRPQAYLLDWHLQSGDEHLIGALHRDHYAVVLTGSEELTYQFAAWYRTIIALDQPLFFYEWADEGIELTSGITAFQLTAHIEQRDTKRRQPPPS